MWIGLVFLLAISCGGLGASNSAHSQTAHPPPRPPEFSNQVAAAAPAAPAVSAPHPAAESKEWDPRWIGIAVTGLMSAFSIILQLALRWWDKRRARDEAEFDQEIGDPLRECYGSLRALNSACSALPNLLNVKEAEEAIKKILQETAPQALTPYASAATNADRLLNRIIFSPYGVELEETFYTELDVIKNTTDQRVRGISQKKISTALTDVIFKSSHELRKERSHYRCTS